MSEWTCKSVGLRIIELPKSVFPAGMAEDIGSYPFFCSSPVVKKINHWLHDGNTILMGTGGVATVHYGQNRFAYSTDTWAFTVADSATNISFLFRQFEHKLKQIEYFGFEGSGLKHLQKEYIRKLELLTPPLNEQNVVVKVLDTIDTAIQQTQAIINKLKQLKQGLLHDLLTRGVDAKGELRPCYEDAPHLYKESPLGWIPKEWEVRSMEDFLERIIDYRGKTPTKTTNGTPLITAKNVRLGYIDSEPREYISDDDFERWMTRGMPRKGDVLFTTEAPLGNAAQIDTDSRLAFAQRVIILQTKDELLNTYLKFVLLGQTFRSQLFSLGSGSTVEGIQQSTFRKLKIAIPILLEEQLIMVKQLTSQDVELDVESERLEKLKKLKSGLMDDLLTGRVRVSSLLQTEASSA